MSFDQFLQKSRTLATIAETNRMSFWMPLYRRLVEILETYQGDYYQMGQELQNEQDAATDRHVRDFYRRKEDELRQALR